MTTELILTAREFAFAHHGEAEWTARMGQHLASVVRFTKIGGGSTAMLAAAWLHDVVEDTAATLAEVEAEFGSEISQLVDGLTDPPHFAALELGFRKERQAARIATLPTPVHVIKVADQTANVAEIAVRPPAHWTHEKAMVYAAGAQHIVSATRGVPEVLYVEFARAFQAARVAHE